MFVMLTKQGTRPQRDFNLMREDRRKLFITIDINFTRYIRLRLMIYHLAVKIFVYRGRFCYELIVNSVVGHEIREQKLLMVEGFNDVFSDE